MNIDSRTVSEVVHPTLQSSWGAEISGMFADGLQLVRLVAFALLFSGVLALLQSATGRLLDHDLRYLGMEMPQLCGISQGRVLRFMFHDRVSFGGALIAIALLYLWLARVPLRAGEPWAWWALMLSGVTGFGSFLSWLGYGYVDQWHAAGALVLLPIFIGGLVLTRGSLRQAGRDAEPLQRGQIQTGSRESFDSRHVLLLATAVGLFAGGTTILSLGSTSVFVPQDLRYIGLGASDLLAINRRLVPLIAHDRASFGGAVMTFGLLLFCCVWFGRPSRSLWWTILLSGSTGFLAAIGVHPLIGYTTFSHLAPAYLGALMFLGGALICYRFMCVDELSQADTPQVFRTPSNL